MSHQTQDQEEARAFLDDVSFGDGTSLSQDEGTKSAPRPAKPSEPPASGSEEAASEPAESDAEAKAREIGWVPKNDFRGDPDKWVSAEEYLDRGERILPLLKKDREKLFKEVQTLKQDLEQFKGYHKADRERVAKREYERGLKDLKTRQMEAVENADTDEYEKIEREKETLEKSYLQAREEEALAAPAGQEGVQPPPPPKSFVDWQKDNPWWGTDQEATEWGAHISNLVLAKNKDRWKGDEREFFDAVKEEVRRRFPEKFANPRRREPPGVEGNEFTGGRGNSGKKTFSDLPPDAKSECQRMEKIGMKREEYIAEYFGQDAISFGP